MTKLHFDDLTKITCPFGMLDDDTQRRLDDHVDAGGAIEGWRDCGWSLCGNGIWDKYITYRAKPQPKRLVSWLHWDEANAVCCESLKEANQYLNNYGGYIYRIERDEDGGNPTMTCPFSSVQTAPTVSDKTVAILPNCNKCGRLFPCQLADCEYAPSATAYSKGGNDE